MCISFLQFQEGFLSTWVINSTSTNNAECIYKVFSFYPNTGPHINSNTHIKLSLSSKHFQFFFFFYILVH